MIIHDAHSDGLALPISHSCLALEVSRSGYYKWLKQPEMVHSVDGEYSDLKTQIQEIALEFPGYGYRRITAELQNRGYRINHKRVLRLMRDDSLLCLKRKFKPMSTRHLKMPSETYGILLRRCTIEKGCIQLLVTDLLIGSNGRLL